MPSGEYLNFLIEVTRRLSPQTLNDLCLFIDIDPRDALVTDLELIKRLEDARRKRYNLIEIGSWDETLRQVSEYLVNRGIVNPANIEAYKASVEDGFRVLDKADSNPLYNAGHTGTLGPVVGGPGYLDRVYQEALEAGLASRRSTADPLVDNWLSF